MDKNALLKYTAGGGIMVMLFTLVLLGKMSSEAFQGLAMGTLGAIAGRSTATRGQGGAP